MADLAKLVDLCEAIVDCPHSTPAWTESGVIVLRSENIRDGRLDLTRTRYTDEAHYAERTRRAEPRAGDLVITREAPMGEVCMIPDGLRCCLGQRMVLLRSDPSKSDSRYLLYALQSDAVQREIQVHEGTGSTVSNLRIPLLEALSIPHHPLVEQKRAAHVLGTLDDKIELNRRMNATLEEMARALFKSWFVDFDPVRAKAEGHDPGLPAPLVNLFPDRLVDSGLGLIPEGWRAGCFGDFLTQRTQRVGTREVVVLSAVATGRLARSDDHFTKQVYSTDTSKYLLVEEGDFAFNPSRINIGSIGTLQESIVGGVSPVYVVARPGRDYRRFLEFALLLPSTKAWITSLSSGSVRQSLNFSDFASIPFAVPPSLVAREFASQWEALRLRIDRAEVGSSVLSQLRDLLLPALITGRLRIFDDDRRTVRSDP